MNNPNDKEFFGAPLVFNGQNCELYSRKFQGYSERRCKSMKFIIGLTVGLAIGIGLTATAGIVDLF
jgi:hypothetical protein